MIAEWAREYVGIPFADRGRDRGGLDCWGLVRLVLAEQFGKHLPSLSLSYESANDEEAVRDLVCAQRPLLKARRVADPVYGDVALLRLRGFLCHVGVYVGDDCMLHVRRGTAAVVDRLSSIIWRRRLEGFYRV
jgi:cell wall-associated NlpC family hydrolase